MSTNILEQIDISKLTIGYPDNILPNSHFSEIRYNKKELIFQTPKISFYSSGTGKFISICFYNYGFNDNTKLFIDKLLEIEKVLYNNSPYLWKKIGESNVNKEFISSIRYSDDKRKAYINLNIQQEKGIPLVSIYDIDKNKVSLDYITDNSTGYCIVYLRGIWRKENKMGLSLVLLQSKVYPSIFKIDKCLILDPDIENPIYHYHNIGRNLKKEIPTSPEIPNENKEDHPIYGKYVKMKRMGIPEPAIAIKCSTEGINFNDFLDYMSGKEIPKPAIPTPIVNKINPMMLQGIQLKKVSKEELEAQKQKRLLSKLKIENPSGFQPPSSNDLMNILKKLKKTISIEKLE